MVLRLTNFINAFLFGVDWSVQIRAERRTIFVRDTGLTSDASRLQVNLEIALSGASATVKAVSTSFLIRPKVR